MSEDEGRVPYSSYASYEGDEPDPYRSLSSSDSISSSSSSSQSSSLSSNKPDAKDDNAEANYSLPEEEEDTAYHFASYLSYSASDEGLYRSYHSEDSMEDSSGGYTPYHQVPLHSSLGKTQGHSLSSSVSSSSDSLSSLSISRSAASSPAVARLPKKKKNRTFTDFFQRLQNQKTEQLLEHHNTGAKSLGIHSNNDSLWIQSDSDSGSSSDEEMDFGEDSNYVSRDWNREFQILTEMSDKYEKFYRLKNLELDFVHTAETYGKIIIQEMCLPNERKTLRPVSVGGVAGGAKYISNGILFKFAVDERNLYGGDHNAIKSASHDLKGMMNYFHLGNLGLHFPLMALINYRGFRLMAISLLPLSSSSLLYGTSDAARTVHVDDPVLNAIMESAAKTMNLKPHQIIPYSHRDHEDMSAALTVCGPADIEGHKGTDGRYYLLDFARVAPPHPPTRPGSQLYELFRLEFVRQYPVPLSSDGFSGFGRIGREVHNKELRDAHAFLLHYRIPYFAFVLCKTSLLDIKRLLQLMHSNGINMRLMGRLRFCLKKIIEGDPVGADPLTRPPLPDYFLDPSVAPNFPEISDYWRSDPEAERNTTINETERENALRLCDMILLEALSRCVKGHLHSLFRTTMYRIKSICEQPFRDIIVDLFNLVIGSQEPDLSKSYWENYLIPDLQTKYSEIFSDEELASLITSNVSEGASPISLSLSSSSSLSQTFTLSNPIFEKFDKVSFFKRLRSLTGIQLRKSCLTSLKSNPGDFEFVGSDLLEIKPKVKHQNIIDYADGRTLYYDAINYRGSESKKLRILQTARRKLSDALQSISTSKMASLSLGDVLSEIAKIEQESEQKGILIKQAIDNYSSILSHQLPDKDLHFQTCYKLALAWMDLCIVEKNVGELLGKIEHYVKEADELSLIPHQTRYLKAQLLSIQAQQMEDSEADVIMRLFDQSIELLTNFLDPAFVSDMHQRTLSLDLLVEVLLFKWKASSSLTGRDPRSLRDIGELFSRTVLSLIESSTHRPKEVYNLLLAKLVQVFGHNQMRDSSHPRIFDYYHHIKDMIELSSPIQHFLAEELGKNPNQKQLLWKWAFDESSLLSNPLHPELYHQTQLITFLSDLEDISFGCDLNLPDAAQVFVCAIRTLASLVDLGPNLKRINFHRINSITDDALTDLSQVLFSSESIFQNIKELSFSQISGSNPITKGFLSIAQSLSTFPSQQNINNLVLRSLDIDDNIMRTFCQNLPNIEKLQIDAVSGITNEILNSVSTLKNLKVLQIIDCEAISVPLLAPLAGCPQIEEIDLRNKMRRDRGPSPENLRELHALSATFPNIRLVLLENGLELVYGSNKTVNFVMNRQTQNNVKIEMKIPSSLNYYPLFSSEAQMFMGPIKKYVVFCGASTKYKVGEIHRTPRVPQEEVAFILFGTQICKFNFTQNGPSRLTMFGQDYQILSMGNLTQIKVGGVDVIRNLASTQMFTSSSFVAPGQLMLGIMFLLMFLGIPK